MTRVFGSNYADDVPTIEEIVAAQSALDADQLAHVRALVEEWQLLADLAFSDLVLWVADREQQGMWAVAQIRPSTGPTTMPRDVVGTFEPTSVTIAENPLTFRPSVGNDAVWTTILPVVHAEVLIAVVERREPASVGRPVSDLESTYRRTSDALIGMMGRGEFPTVTRESTTPWQVLRVGDGLIRTDVTGMVTWASPNALSAYRRMGLAGDLIGASLSEVTMVLADHIGSSRDIGQLFAGESAEAEIEGRGASVVMRVLQMKNEAGPDGNVVLLRDVTELRKRERELVSKDATIREIHHRVKNNLQTVAALLRLQGRRLDEPAAREALKEAEQRVASIAIVHETLSYSFDETVPFDEVADRLVRSVLDVGGPGVTWQRSGTFGALASADATPLAMVLTELVQNAYEHAFGPAGGSVTIEVERRPGRVRMTVSDDGAGLPEDFDRSASLGLSIVSTLVEGELAGSLAFERGPISGTRVRVEFSPSGE